MRFITLTIIFVCVLCNCSSPKESNLECCFEQIKIKIESKSDTILSSLKQSSINSYGDYSKIIHEAVMENSKENLNCSSAIDSFMFANKQNSITVNNLILFQQFQSYLKKDNFNLFEAKKKALEYEKKHSYK